MASTTTDFVDLYAVLAVSETASDDEIRHAIKQQRRVWTKRQGAADARRRQEAEQRVRDIDSAEKVLLSASSRKSHDQERLRHGSQAAPAPVETDGQRDWLATAKQHYEAGQAAAANYAAREAINTNGSDHGAWYIRAHSSFMLGNWRDSEYEFNEAIRLRPNESEYHFDLGSVYEAAGQWSDALRKYEDALKIEPGNPMYKVSIASVYLQNSLPERALPLVEEVVKSHPEIEAFQFYLAWALADNIANYATVLNDDSFILTSEQQASRALRDMERASKLKFTEPDMRQYIKKRLAWAQDAVALQWGRPASFTPLLVAVGVILLIMLIGGTAAVVFGILALGGLGFAYQSIYKVPGWKIQLRIAKAQSYAVKRWGEGSNR